QSVPNNQYPITDNYLYRTGDRARWQPDGNIEFLGRIDQQVKIRGYRIELGEIENQLLTQTQIKEAVVTVRNDENGNKHLCAYLVTEPGTDDETPVDREILHRILPDYMIPTYFITLEKIPLTPNGKVDRNALSQYQPLRAQSKTSYVAPGNITEKKLTEIWAKILNMEKETISIDDDFFRLGGQSLMATLMITKIHKEFNTKLPMVELFNAPSIRKLSKKIKGLEEDKYDTLEPVEKKEYYTLSSAQKRMYFLHQMNSKRTVYNIPLILPLTEELEKNRLEKAVRALIHRHESLRTTFEIVGEEPVQKVHEVETLEIKIEYYETDGETHTVPEHPAHMQGPMEPAGITGTVESIINGFVRPFDMTQAPLIRVGLIKLNKTAPAPNPQPPAKNIFLVDMHHIISDGVSRMILAEEFFALYRGEETKTVKLQYKDYSQWQNNLIGRGEIKMQEDYWLDIYSETGQALPEGRPRLDLYTDYKRPGVFTYAGASYQFTIEPEETAGFRAQVLDSGGTLYMNALALLNTLFYKYTGQTDIIIGTPVAGRQHDDLQQIVGLFVNTLPMRNQPQGDKEYRTFLNEVITRSIQAFQNQEVQFEELVDKLEPRRAPSRNPLFDISMVVGNYIKPDEKPAKKENRQPWGDRERTSLKPGKTTSKFD
ncbi:MAG: hypothetical protein GY757_17270, partial [bacterium]|nr:hypothetical protein [bacterium]